MTQVVCDVQVDYVVARYSEQEALAHLWSITVDGERVSELWVAIDSGEIKNVWTHEAYRERGYATALYRRAAGEVAVFHAPVGHRTADGDRFAVRTGGPELVCTTCCVDLDTDDYDGEEH